MITAKVNNNIDTKKIKKRVQQANFKSVEHAAAAIRLSAIRMIRQGRIKDGKRIPSVPGQPPKKWTNKSNRHIKRSILYTKGEYAKGKTSASVYAGPDKSGDRIYRMHEYGGSQTVEVYKKMVKDRTYRENFQTYNPDRYKPMSQRSDKEQEAIKNYYDNIETVKVKKTARYQPRPFLDPAVKKNLAKIPEIWKSNITKVFH